VPAIIGASSAAAVIALVVLVIAAVCVKKKKTEKTMHAIAVAVSNSHTSKCTLYSKAINVAINVIKFDIATNISTRPK